MHSYQYSCDWPCVYLLAFERATCCCSGNEGRCSDELNLCPRYESGLFPRGPDGNLGGGLFAIVANYRLRRLEPLDNVQNSTAALAKEVAPFATLCDR